MENAELNRYSGQTVLAIGAHPDDIELGLGGTVASLKRQGARVIMAVGCIPTEFDGRLKEAQQAAGILGGELRVLYDEGCSRIEDRKTYELVTKIDDLLQECKPKALFAHGSADFHKDHQMIYDACHASQRLGFMDFFCYYPTGCRPLMVKFYPQAFVDVSETMDIKMEAVRAHHSQFSGRSLPMEHVRDLARENGRLSGLPYAEALEVVRMRLC